MPSSGLMAPQRTSVFKSKRTKEFLECDRVNLADLNDDLLMSIIDSMGIVARARLGQTCQKFYHLVESRWRSVSSFNTLEIFPPRRRIVTISSLRLERVLGFISTRMHSLTKVVFSGRILSTDERPLIRTRAATLRRNNDIAPLQFLCTFLESVSGTLESVEFDGCFVIRPNDNGSITDDAVELSSSVNNLLSPALAKLSNLKRFAFLRNCLSCGEMLSALTSNLEVIELLQNSFLSQSLIDLIRKSPGLRQIKLSGQKYGLSRFRNCDISAELLRAVASLEKLELLEISEFARDSIHPSVSSHDLKDLVVSPALANSLRHLSLTWNGLMRGKVFSPDVFGVLAGLRYLDISGHKFKPGDLQILCNLTKLKYLNISDNNCGLTSFITGDVLEALARSLTCLEEFNIGDVRQVTQDQLLALAGLTSLREIILATESLSKEVFVSLGSQLRQLRSVFIRTKAKTIDDDSLVAFARSTPLMRVFHLLNSKITNVGLSRLVAEGLWVDIRGFDVTGGAVNRQGEAMWLDARSKLKMETDMAVVQRCRAG